MGPGVQEGRQQGRAADQLQELRDQQGQAALHGPRHLAQRRGHQHVHGASTGMLDPVSLSGGSLSARSGAVGMVLGSRIAGGKEGGSAAGQGYRKCAAVLRQWRVMGSAPLPPICCRPPRFDAK